MAAEESALLVRAFIRAVESFLYGDSGRRIALSSAHLATAGDRRQRDVDRDIPRSRIGIHGWQWYEALS